MPFPIHLKLLLYSSEYRIFGESQFYFEDLLFKHTALYLCKIAIVSLRIHVTVLICVALCNIIIEVKFILQIREMILI